MFDKVLNTPLIKTLCVKFQKQSLKGVLRKRCSETCKKFTGEHPCRSVISVKLSNFIEIILAVCQNCYHLETSQWICSYRQNWDKMG